MINGAFGIPTEKCYINFMIIKSWIKKYLDRLMFFQSVSQLYN